MAYAEKSTLETYSSQFFQHVEDFTICVIPKYVWAGFIHDDI